MKKKTYTNKIDFLEDYDIQNLSTFTDEQKQLFNKYTCAPVVDKHGDLYIITPNPNLIKSIQQNRIPKELIQFKSIINTKDKIIVLEEPVYHSIVNQESILNKKYTENDGQILFKDILTDASRKSASDIHLTWRKNDVVLKYRIDGRIVTQSKEIAHNLAATFKNICINRTGSDEYEKNEIAGQFEEIIDGRNKEYRLSIGPTVSGFTIVIRAASSISKDTTMKKWNYSDKAIKIIEEMKKLKYGIVLVTGPTGSGKSTLLYTIANELSLSGDFIIKTVEDPVEIAIDGIDQVNVNVRGEKESWMTFARAIKMFLRQDPDLIIVGEIRDNEVAQAAISAAKTGHLTFSTLHTNDVASTISRLYDLGLQKVDIEDGLRGVISQRLIPTLCNDCKIEVEYKGAKYWDRNPEGCKNCETSTTPGYKGRVPLTEVALLGNMPENYKRENFIEYLSLEESIIEMLETGRIDRAEAQKHIQLGMGDDLSFRKEMVEIWNRALRNKEELTYIYPVFQPIIDKRGFTFGYEIFTRMKNLNEELINTQLMLENAEKIGILPDMLSYSLKNTIKEIKKTNKIFFLNLTRSEILNKDYIASLIETIEKEQIKEQIVLEFEFNKKYLQFIENLIKEKIKFSYQNFEGKINDLKFIQKNKIHPTYIKTTKDFIEGISHEEEWLNIYIQVLNEAKSKIIASFVETEGLYSSINENFKTIEYFQGSYFGTPEKQIKI